MSPDHFFYKMTFGEAAAFMRGLEARERLDWERTRCVMYAAMAPHSKKIKKYSDAMRFPWDDEANKPKKNVTVDKCELERVREMAKKIKL